jgi:esterase
VVDGLAANGEDGNAEVEARRMKLAEVGREMPKILSFPETAGRFGGPALFLRGARSDYVRPEHREPVLALFPDARFATVEGAGHWLHAEKPHDTVAAVTAFLD